MRNIFHSVPFFDEAPPLQILVQMVYFKRMQEEFSEVILSFLKLGGIHKLRRQVYYISLCSSIGIWPTPSPLACLRSLWMPPKAT